MEIAGLLFAILAAALYLVTTSDCGVQRTQLVQVLVMATEATLQLWAKYLAQVELLSLFCVRTVFRHGVR